MTDQELEKIAQKLRPIELSPLPDRPLVSVLMANHNYARYIAEAIESVLAQTYQHFELIVCDDGSTDNSREVVEQFVSRDSRVRLLSKENGGVASALNAAYAVSTGEIICLLDSDDLFLPEKLEKVVEAFKKFGRSAVCLNRIVKMDKEGRTFGYPGPVVFPEGWVAAEALRSGGRVRTMPPASAISFRKPVADLLLPVPSQLRRVVDGYLCYTAQFFTEVCAVHSALTKYRCHGGSLSGTGEFTAVSLSRYLEDLKSIIILMGEFLANHYGSRVAKELRIEDNSQYWSFLLALHVLSGDGSKEVCGEPLKKVVEHIRPYQQRLLARVLLALPVLLSQRALRCWTGQSASTAMIVRTVRSFLRI